MSDMPRTHVAFLLVIGVLGVVTSGARMWQSWRAHARFDLIGYGLALVVAIWALVVAIRGIRGRARAMGSRASVRELPNDR